MTVLGELRRTSEPADSAWLLHHVRVIAVERVGSSFTRVTLTGPDLDRVADTGRDQRNKVFVPVLDHGLDDLPLVEDVYEQWRALPDDRRNPMRTYTLRTVRPELREIDLYFVLHEPCGPAGAWARDVELGDELVAHLPNSAFAGEHGGIDFDPPADVSTFLLAGDETAAPAIAGILDSLPATARGVAIIELPNAADAAVLPTHPSIDVRVLPRTGARNTALVEAVAAAAAGLADGTTAPSEVEDVDVDLDLLWEVPRDEATDPRAGLGVYAWIAGEAAGVKQLRRQLVSELGWDRRAVAFMGYWREGKAEAD